MKPRLIEGNIFRDDRGAISFVNDFNLKDIVRFYIVENAEGHEKRGWHGHKYDHKNFYCIQGSFKIGYVKIDNWEHPSDELVPESVVLTQTKSSLLHIPPGYANMVISLEPNSRLLSFSTLQLDQTEGDSVRYDIERWIL